MRPWSAKPRYVHGLPPRPPCARSSIPARLAGTITTVKIAVVPFTAQAPIATLNGWGITDDLVTVESDAGNVEIADPEL